MSVLVWCVDLWMWPLPLFLFQVSTEAGLLYKYASSTSLFMPLVAWATRVCLFATCPSSCRPCWTSCLIKVSSACLYYTYSTQLWKQTKIQHYSLCLCMWNYCFLSSTVSFAPQSQYSVVRSATLCTDHKSCAARMFFFSFNKSSEPDGLLATK